MVQESLEKCYGQWNWPAGHVDEGETPEIAAVREAREEVGLDVVLGARLGEWKSADNDRTFILFKAESFGGQLRIPEDEILGAAWLSKEQIIVLRDSMRLADWTVDFLADERI